MLHQRVVEGGGEDVPCPLGEHDRDDDEDQELDVVSDLHHDDGQGHGETRDPAHEGHCPQQREGARVQPVPVAVLQHPEHVHAGSAQQAAVQRADQDHGDHEAARDVGPGGPAGEQEVEAEHRDQRAVAELEVSVAGEEMLDRLLARQEEEGGGLVVGGVGRAGVALHVRQLHARPGAGERRAGECGGQQHGHGGVDQHDGERLPHLQQLLQPPGRHLAQQPQPGPRQPQVEGDEEGAQQPAQHAEHDSRNNSDDVEIYPRVDLK